MALFFLNYPVRISQKSCRATAVFTSRFSPLLNTASSPPSTVTVPSCAEATSCISCWLSFLDSHIVSHSLCIVTSHASPLSPKRLTHSITRKLPTMPIFVPLTAAISPGAAVNRPAIVTRSVSAPSFDFAI